MTTQVSLSNPRWLSFLGAQFLGAFNDNAFKLVVSMASLSMIAEAAAQQSYLAMTSALAILPFLLFSGYAGYFGDRYAKSNVLRISKAAEILAMGAALVVFMQGQSLSHLLITLFLLATHSAFFSPSKYGILPEILSAEDLPKANGYLNMLTFVAIILGSLSGAALWGAYKATPEIIGYILTGIAVLGTFLCLFVPKSRPGDREKQFNLNPFAEIIASVRLVRGQHLLATCLVGSAMFWMLGGLIYLSLIMLGRSQLGLDEMAAGTLFAFLASGIAVGSVVAGYVIGKTLRRGLIVWGALMLGVGCVLTGLFPTSYTLVAALIALVGVGGGLFIVPVVTLLQKNSPEEKRGQLLAAVGFFDMLGVLLASGIFWLLGTYAGLSASSIIMAAGAISLAGMALTLYHAPILGKEFLEPLMRTTSTQETLGHRFIASAKQSLLTPRVSDTAGRRLRGITALAGARRMSQWLAPRLDDAPNVALLLPATVVGALTNIALALLGKTSVNLNFSLGEAAMREAMAKAEITRIVTARRMIEKLEMAPDERMIFLEDAVPTLKPARAFFTLLQALLLPTNMLAKRWLSGDQRADAAAVILFSSGSTAQPKAVVLTHAQIIANITSVDALLQAEEAKQGAPLSFAGTLPFFHSFGLTVCTWLPAITGRYIAYHASPLEAKQVVKMIAEEKCQLLVSTPTFMRHYIAAAKNDGLASLRLVILGGEKLSDAAAESFAKALPQAHILQGYGCTELGPVVAINLPGATREHSVGRPIPGVHVRVVSLESGAVLGTGEEGLILVQSPSRMQHYYRDEARTEAALVDGWYNTGDIGRVDADGFIFITDRVARFSKIGGEMVPHGKIEAVIEEILGAKHAVVVAVADARKGERLYVLSADKTLSAAELHARLSEKNLPNLWIPARENILAIDEIPLLATGKIDLRACKQWVEKETKRLSAAA